MAHRPVQQRPGGTTQPGRHSTAKGPNDRPGSKVDLSGMTDFGGAEPLVLLIRGAVVRGSRSLRVACTASNSAALMMAGTSTRIPNDRRITQNRAQGRCAIVRSFQLRLSPRSDCGPKRRETLLESCQFILRKMPGAAGRHALRAFEKSGAQIGMLRGAGDIFEGAQ